MSTRLPASWAKKGSKMRNKPVWECQGCGIAYTAKPSECGYCPSKDIAYFQSRKEHDRWCELKAMEKAGQIRGLERQVKFTFTFNGYTLRSKSGKQDLSYWADFVYKKSISPINDESSWTQVIEDAKGRPNEVYPIKRELMKAMGYEIRET